MDSGEEFDAITSARATLAKYRESHAPADTEQPSEAEQDRCILCVNGNDLPEGEYCRGCGRENNLRPLGAAVMKARGINLPPKTKLKFSEQPITAKEAAAAFEEIVMRFGAGVIPNSDDHQNTNLLRHYIEQTAQGAAQDREDAISEANLAALLPDSYYMDPPDGGDVSITEQLRRMAQDAERCRWLRDHSCIIAADGEIYYGPGYRQHEPEYFDQSIDQARQQGKE